MSQDTTSSTSLNPGGNPQGKGLSLVLERLAGLSATRVQAKSLEEVLRDYWQSSLVLSAEFSFRVVPGNRYYLYRGDSWRLSLISPEEWGSRLPGLFVASCELSTDASWQVEFADTALADPAVVDALRNFLEGFQHRLEQSETLADALPTYESSLPYQQRMMATALATSLRHSARLSGCAMVSPRLATAEWRTLAIASGSSADS
jgi:hypothetical protein